MANKIKVVIMTPETKINLPRFSFATAIRFVRFGLWGSSFFTKQDPQFQQLIKDNKDLIITFLKQIEKDIKHLEPFTLVEVKSDDSHIHITIQ